MKTIRSSEIGSYVYCQRAWWLQKLGHEPENRSALSAGQIIHARHGRAVFTAGCLRSIAFVLLLSAVLIVTIYLALQII